MDGNYNRIVAIEKPDDISFMEIHNVIWEANELNRRKGIFLNTAILDGEKISKRIGTNGKCFIALEGNRVIGTISVRIVKRNKWYYKGEIPNYMLAAVIPAYQGKHINTLLTKKVFEFARNNGYCAVELDTAEENAHAIEAYRHQGFMPVDCIVRQGANHYSIVMIKWLSKCPYSDHKRAIMYWLRKLYTHARYRVCK